MQVNVEMMWACIFGFVFGACGVCVWLMRRQLELGLRCESQAKRLEDLASEREALVKDLQGKIAQEAASEVKLSRLVETQEALNQAHTHEKDEREKRAEVENALARVSMELDKERQAHQEKLVLVTEAQEELANAFKALSSEALRSNNQAFLELAKSTLETTQAQAKGDLAVRHKAIEKMVEPLKDSLMKVDTTILQMEKLRSTAYGSLSHQLESLKGSQEALQKETHTLAQALKSSSVRGRWGEFQLRRVVEMAGMVAHCDFLEQVSTGGQDGTKKPDMVVVLPGSKQLVIDAKAPLSAYLEAIEAPDEASCQRKLKEHAQQFRRHVTALAAKSYWEQFTSSPEFVVMFVPSDSIYGAAVQNDPELPDYAVNKKILLATPMTLIALLKGVAYSWQNEQLAQNAQLVRELGKELYLRLQKFSSHFVTMKKGLDAAIKSYNGALGSFEGRVLVSARRFQELGAGTADTLEVKGPIEAVARSVESVTMTEDVEPAKTRDRNDPDGASVIRALPG
jgi:DNA recombination protein RmuC